MSEKEDNIDGNYSSYNLKVNVMLEELNGKIKSMIKNIPEVFIKFSIQKKIINKITSG